MARLEQGRVSRIHKRGDHVRFTIEFASGDPRDMEIPLAQFDAMIQNGDQIGTILPGGFAGEPTDIPLEERFYFRISSPSRWQRWLARFRRSAG